MVPPLRQEFFPLLGRGAACFLVCSCLLLCITCSACAGNLKTNKQMLKSWWISCCVPVFVLCVIYFVHGWPGDSSPQSHSHLGLPFGALSADPRTTGGTVVIRETSDTRRQMTSQLS